MRSPKISILLMRPILPPPPRPPRRQRANATAGASADSTGIRGRDRRRASRRAPSSDRAFPPRGRCSPRGRPDCPARRSSRRAPRGRGQPPPRPAAGPPGLAARPPAGAPPRAGSARCPGPPAPPPTLASRASFPRTRRGRTAGRGRRGSGRACRDPRRPPGRLRRAFRGGAGERAKARHEPGCAARVRNRPPPAARLLGIGAPRGVRAVPPAPGPLAPPALYGARRGRVLPPRCPARGVARNADSGKAPSVGPRAPGPAPSY